MKNRYPKDEGNREKFNGSTSINKKKGSMKKKKKNMRRMGGQGLSLEAFANAKSNSSSYFNPALISIKPSPLIAFSFYFVKYLLFTWVLVFLCFCFNVFLFIWSSFTFFLLGRIYIHETYDHSLVFCHIYNDSNIQVWLCFLSEKQKEFYKNSKYVNKYKKSLKQQQSNHPLAIRPLEVWFLAMFYCLFF